MTNTPTTFFSAGSFFADTAVSRILFTRAAYHIGNIPRRYDLWMLFEDFLVGIIQATDIRAQDNMIKKGFYLVFHG